MTYNDFLRLTMDASEFDTRDDYITEVGGSVPPTVPDDKMLPLLDACWAYGRNRSVATVRGISGLSRAGFAREYRLPLRTVENWESESDSGRTAPGYVVDLLAWAVVNDIVTPDEG